MIMMEEKEVTLTVESILCYVGIETYEVQLKFRRFEEAIPLLATGTFLVTYFEETGKLTVSLNTRSNCVLVRQNNNEIILNINGTVFKIIVK